MKRLTSELKNESNQPTSGLRIAQSVLLCLLLIAAGFTGGMLVQRTWGTSEWAGQFADLEAVYQVIDSDYYYLPTDDVDRSELDADMEEGAIAGALASLGDTYTRYLGIDETSTAQEGLQGKYGGVGIDIVIEQDLVLVNAVVPSSPADRAGIRRGDVIEQINGARIQETDANDVLRMLRGEIGSTLSLTLVRPNTGDLLALDLTLEEIVVPSVTLKFIEDTDYAWIRITIFGDSTVADLDAAIAEMRTQGSSGLILDLRGNGGGWVGAAQQTLGRFLDPSLGPAMYEDTTFREGMAEMPIEVGDGIVPLDIPMVVLIDGGTASAAEIVAGAMRDYQRATLVGTKTFGKGSVQRIYEFSDGSTLRVTVAEWFTPSKARIQAEGIHPDVETDIGGQIDDQDPVIAAAILVLDSGF